MNASAALDEVLDWLECPVCRGALATDGDSALACSGGHRYPVADGMPLLFRPEDMSRRARRTVDAFGTRWRRFHPSGGYMSSRELLLDYIHPVTPESFAGQEVLDAGCGSGRFSKLACEMGARVVFGLDASTSVVSPAGASLRDERRWHGVRADIFRLPFRRRFDFVMSLGVLHHLEDPARGFRELAGVLKPGGRISIWVYGREGNRWILDWVDPLRIHLTSRLPGWALEAVCLPLGALLYAASRRTVGRKLLRAAGGGEALESYCESFVRHLDLWETVGVVYDHLVAPKADYLSRADVERMFADAGVELLSLTARNGNSWRAHGRRPS